jgi:methylmalonyl-CoA/ethylmalonyl-CoA epimerase
MSSSLVDLSHEKIVQFSVVVKDVEKTAKRFAEIFGIHWKLYSLRLENVVLHNETTADARGDVKIAVGNFGGRSLKLIQPGGGGSSYAEFLENKDEGFYALGFGTLPNHDQVVEGLRKAGINLEMQGNAGHGSRFSIMDVTEDLGCRIEFSSPSSPLGGSGLPQTGVIVPESQGLVDMAEPVFSGGKRINQVGIVLQDEKRAARKFEELLGIGGWMYAYGPPGLTDARLYGEPVQESAMESLDVAFALSWLGDLQIEIIKPIGLRPGGCHQRFLDKRGNGIQHVSFGIQGDCRAFVETMKKAGIGVEFTATIRDHGVSAYYLATQHQLGGFQLEIVGRA